MTINMDTIMYSKLGADHQKSFAKLVVGHTKLIALRTALRDALFSHEQPLIIGVAGPTGVGKSLLLRLLERDIIDHWLTEMHQDPGFIPVASICVPAPELGSFLWESYYHLALKAHQEPLIQAKVLDAERDQVLESLGESRKVVRALRRALENCLRYRRTRAVLIDEGQHLSRAVGKVTAEDQAHHLLDLARATQTTHVLFGNHELVEMLRRLLWLPWHFKKLG
jgi:ATPase subunit of ABC transporter with duplicated ATPase domains